MAAILCLDFDETIVMDDTSRQLFERFAPPGWRDLATAHDRGELTVEQYHAAAFATIEASREEMVAFARSVARPRAGVMNLAAWANAHRWQLAVLSDGLDIYIDPLLDDLGLDRVARHCGRTIPGYRWRATYLSPRGVEIQQGFKLAYVSALAQAGDFVVYAGDGRSDIDAARQAAAVFARGALRTALRDEHPRAYPFDTFDDVVAVLDREADSWLSAASPR